MFHYRHQRVTNTDMGVGNHPFSSPGKPLESHRLSDLQVGKVTISCWAYLVLQENAIPFVDAVHHSLKHTVSLTSPDALIFPSSSAFSSQTDTTFLCDVAD